MTREMWAADAATRLRDLIGAREAAGYPGRRMQMIYAPTPGADPVRITLDDLRALLTAARCEETAPPVPEDDGDLRCVRLRTHTDADPMSSHVWQAPASVPGRPRIEWRA